MILIIRMPINKSLHFGPLIYIRLTIQALRHKLSRSIRTLAATLTVTLGILRILRHNYVRVIQTRFHIIQAY